MLSNRERVLTALSHKQPDEVLYGINPGRGPGGIAAVIETLQNQ